MKNSSFAVEKYLKRKRESVLVDLWINNYSKNNLYLAIVYNSKIDMYKVLYIPLDLIDAGKIDDYACYQFIDMISVNYILESLKDAEDKYKDVIFRNRVNKLIDNYAVEININVGGNKYQFQTTRFIPKEWIFMFDLIVTIFSYAPNIINWLCEDLLTLFKNESEDILYQQSFEFDILRDDDKLLNEKFGEDILDFKNISYLEKINNKYFSIISEYVVIVEYEAGIINTYCECNDYNSYILTVIMAIRNNIERKFNKMMVVDKDKEDKARCYLVYGLTDSGIKVIHGCSLEIIPYSSYYEGLIKFIEDVDGLEEKINS